MFKKIVSVILCCLLLLPGGRFAAGQGARARAPGDVLADCTAQIAEEMIALSGDIAGTYSSLSLTYASTPNPYAALRRAGTQEEVMHLKTQALVLSKKINALGVYLEDSGLAQADKALYSSYKIYNSRFSGRLSDLRRIIEDMEAGSQRRVLKDVQNLTGNIARGMEWIKVRALLKGSSSGTVMKKAELLRLRTAGVVEQLICIAPKVRALAEGGGFAAPLIVPGLENIVADAARNAEALSAFKQTLEKIHFSKESLSPYAGQDFLAEKKDFKIVQENIALLQDLEFVQKAQTHRTFAGLKGADYGALADMVYGGAFTAEGFRGWLVVNTAALPPGGAQAGLAPGGSGRGKSGAKGGKAGGAAIGIALFITGLEIYKNVNNARERGQNFARGISAEYLAENGVKENFIAEYKENPADALVFYALGAGAYEENMLLELVLRSDGTLPPLDEDELLALEERADNLEFMAYEPGLAREAWGLLQIAFELDRYAEEMEDVPQFDPGAEMSVPFGVKRG